jgi:hypothetical protein
LEIAVFVCLPTSPDSAAIEECLHALVLLRAGSQTKVIDTLGSPIFALTSGEALAC